MIIWGTYGKNLVISEGEFFCPQCAANQPYTHFEVRNYFTLYFIPLFPLGRGGEFIQCDACEESWSPDILTYDPEEELRENATAVRRLAVLFLLDVGRCTSTTMNALRLILHATFEVEISRDDIANDVIQAQKATPNVTRFFKSQSVDFPAEGKSHLIDTLCRLLESDGQIQSEESDRIVELGKAIGLRAKVVKEIIRVDREASA